ncbi:hypothetical protein ILUMI_06715 [Ignelater luminosus]|uniref:Transposase Tc1-like domain-containing protein n=1 Tax=Ignelater luminosus TaxID=2038154 RepID=A0A8K0GCA7_IGNLU|nr:hypothetical protein ILUMI_06715 [Ignelater luminosus]
MVVSAENCAKVKALVKDGRSQRKKNDDRFLVLNTLRNRHLTSVETKNQLRGTKVSVWTVWQRLQEVGLKACWPATGPKLLRCHRVARLQFARKHSIWNLAQWSTVLFTDESRFCLYSPDVDKKGNDFQSEHSAPSLAMEGAQ